MSSHILSHLVSMSKHLGNPKNDYVILGEGNTSAKIDQKKFWVKASGKMLRESRTDSFVQVYSQPLLEMLNQSAISDTRIGKILSNAKVNPHAPGHPSMEAAFHAVCLQFDNIHFVGHTHPTAVNMFTCSVAFESALQGRLFPDEIVINGIAPLLIPYADPGLPLAREIKRGLHRYYETYNEPPRVIFLQNHGLIALGSTAQQVINVTAMAVKAVRILHGTYVFGGPNFLPQQAVNRIHTRQDEHYREKIINSFFIGDFHEREGQSEIIS